MFLPLASMASMSRTDFSIYVQRALQLHFWIICVALFVVHSFVVVNVPDPSSTISLNFIWVYNFLRISPPLTILMKEGIVSTLVSKEHDFKIEFQQRVKECVKFAVKLFQHFDRQQRRESGEKSLLISSLWNSRRSFTLSFE